MLQRFFDQFGKSSLQIIMPYLRLATKMATVDPVFFPFIELAR